jgi:TetR/AcrR family transcriptional regulator, transcriptional repressor for nem operon
MKVSKEKAAENRDALIQAAARLFRERGIDGVGVAELGKAAGLTHGALYAQFSSKQELTAEAVEEGLRASNAKIFKRGAGHAEPLAPYFDYYLSARHRKDLSGGCAIAALACDIGRQDAVVSASFAGGFAGAIDAIAAALLHLEPDQREARAMSIVSLLSGAVAASRAAVKADPALADRILLAAREAVDRLAGIE